MKHIGEIANRATGVPNVLVDDQSGCLRPQLTASTLLRVGIILPWGQR
jgi:hypothetical protein